MQDSQRRITTLHRLAWACAALVLAVTTLSAFVRLTRAGVGCEPWPQCQLQRAQPAAAVPMPTESADLAGVRIAHRIAASGALLLIVFMLMIALARQPALREPGRLVLGLLALALFLAVLGRMAGDSPAPAVVLGNLLGGMAMFGLCWHLVQATGKGAQGGRLRAWALAALALLVLQLALGGLASAARAAAQCDTSLLCQAHRGNGLLTALVLATVGALNWRSRPMVASALLLLVLAQVTIGVSMLSLALPLSLAVAHNVVAALLIAALVALVWPATKK